jgi:hypothetical protein
MFGSVFYSAQLSFYLSVYISICLSHLFSYFSIFFLLSNLFLFVSFYLFFVWNTTYVFDSYINMFLTVHIYVKNVTHTGTVLFCCAPCTEVRVRVWSSSISYSRVQSFRRIFKPLVLEHPMVKCKFLDRGFYLGVL